MHWIKLIAIFLLVGFALFYLFNQPESAGEFVSAVWEVIVRIFEAIIIFFQTLTA